MHKFLLLALFTFAMQPLAAQSTFEWIRTPATSMPFNGDLVGYSAICDAQGNVLYSGYESDGTAYGSEILGTVFIKKYDSDGGLLFSKQFTGQVAVHNMVCDSQGNILMAIGFRESVSIGSETFSTENQGVEPMLVKLNANGDLLWQMIPGIEEGVVEHFTALAVDTSDNVYIGYGNYNDSYLMRLTPLGIPISTILQHKVKMLTSISVDGQGNVYTSGACAETPASFNGVAAPIDLTYNLYVAKYDASDAFQWVRYVEDITCPFPVVKANSPDAVYFSSALADAFPFGTLPTEGPGTGSEDFFIAKLDASGTFQWVREVPGSGQAGLGYRNTLELDDSGNVYFAGRTRGSINWGDSHTTQAMGFHSDALVLKYDPDGSVLLARTVSGTTENRFDAVAVDHQGGIFLTGFSYGSIVLDDLEHESEDNFTFLAKLQQANLDVPLPNADTIVLYPNPATNHIRLSGNFFDNNATFYNALGQRIKTARLSSNVDFPISDLSQGAYFLKIEGVPTKQFFKL